MIQDEFNIVYKPSMSDRSFNPAITYLHPYLNKRMYNIDLIHIWYDANDIFNDVAARTAYIGKSTVVEGQHQLDLLAMTEDEKNDLFRDMLIDAHSVVFENIKAFTHGLRGEVMRYRDMKTGEEFKGAYDSSASYNVGDVVEDKGKMYECVCSCDPGSIMDTNYFVETPCFCIAEYWIEKKWWFNPNAKRMLDNAVKQAIVEYIMYRWFEITNTQQAEIYMNKFNKRMDDLLYTINSQEKPLRRRHRLF